MFWRERNGNNNRKKSIKKADMTTARTRIDETIIPVMVLICHFRSQTMYVAKAAQHNTIQNTPSK